MKTMSTREAAKYLQEHGVNISYNRLLQLVRNNNGPAFRRTEIYCGTAYRFTREDLDEFLATKTTRCPNCGNLVEKGKFCSKKCEQLFYTRKRKERTRMWFEDCPFMNGSLQSYIPGYDILSAECCPLM